MDISRQQIRKMNSLYIHIPFCEKKCFYCSFVVSIGQQKRMGEYIQALDEESGAHSKSGVDTVYIGGGTPSLLSSQQLKALFAVIAKNFDVNPLAEKTIEANPESLDDEKILLLKEEGFHRISLGTQTFQKKYLKYLGRNHNAQQSIQAVESLKRNGIDNINVDLMFGFPGQTQEELNEDLVKITSLGTQHISLYGLTIEHPSRFFTQKIKLDDDQQARQYRMIIEFLESVGFHQYEVSNFARLGKESTHNVNYWEGGNYVGLGIGAHSHRDGVRFWNISQLLPYIDFNRQGKSVIGGKEELTTHMRFVECLLFGLRMNRGIDVKLLEKRFTVKLDATREKIIDDYVRMKRLFWDGDFLKTTLEGRLILDDICARLV
jgi:oxygen-independent coproporphyrinogen-3 oxidase